MSAFLGGFAASLKGYIDKDMEDKRLQEQEKRKMEFLKEMEKWKMDNTVASSELDPSTGEVIYFNANGVEMNRRPATQAQLDRYTAEKKKTDAELKEANASAGIAQFNLENAPRTLESTLATHEAQRVASGAQARAANARAAQDEWMTGAMRDGRLPMPGTGGRGGGRGGSTGDEPWPASAELSATEMLSKLEMDLARGYTIETVSNERGQTSSQRVDLTKEQKDIMKAHINDLRRGLAERGSYPRSFGGQGRNSLVETLPYGQSIGVFPYTK